MSVERKPSVGMVILHRWAHVMFWLYVGFMISNAIQWARTGDPVYLRSMGVHSFMASATANLILIFAEWRGKVIRPRWAAPVLSFFTWMFLVGLLIISWVPLSKGETWKALPPLVIGIILARLRYRAYQHRAQNDQSD